MKISDVMLALGRHVRALGADRVRCAARLGLPLGLAALFVPLAAPFITAQAAAPLIERWERSTPDTEVVYNVSSVTWRLQFDQWVDDVDSDFSLENCSGCELRVSPSNGQGKVFHVTVYGDSLSDRNHSVELSIRSDHDIRNANGERLPNNKRFGTVVHEGRYIIRNRPYVLNVRRSNPTTYDTNANSVSWTYEFSEPMEDVEASDFYLQETTATLSLTNNEDDRIFTLTASGGNLADLDREIRIWPNRDHDMRDKQGNALVTRAPVHSDQTRFRIDNTAPRWRYSSRQNPWLEATTGHSVTYFIIFDEDVVPQKNHFSLVNGRPTLSQWPLAISATSVTKHENRSNEYLVTFANLQNVDSYASIYLNDHLSTRVPDKAGNLTTGSFYYSTQEQLDYYLSQYYDIDNIHPFITLVGLGDYVTARQVDFRMDWNEIVTNFVATDIEVDGGSISSFNDDYHADLRFSMRLTAEREGSVTISVPRNAAGDRLDNESIAFSKTVIFDWTPPTVNSIVRQNPTAWATNSDTLRWRVTFSESVTGVDAADFGLSGTTAGLHVTEVQGSSGRQYDVSASNGNLASVDGIVKLAFRTGYTVADRAGNALVNPTPTGSIKDTYRLDNTAPTVAIGGVPVTASGPFTATLRFSEAVNGFEQSDIAATGAALSSFTATGDGREWTVRVTPNADYRLAIAAGAALDAAGNNSLANDGEGARGILLAAGAGLVVAPESLTIAEGSSGTFSLALAAAPTGPMTVALSSDNGDVTVSPTTLNFTTANWDTPQTVTASASVDSDAVNESATITVNPSGGGYDALADGSVAVTVTDRDARLKVAPVSLTMAEGSSKRFTVVLAAVPTGPVTVALSSDNGDVTVSPNPLTFSTSDWNTPQTVTVRADPDEDAGDDSALVGLALSGGGYDGVSGGSVSVTVTDDDAGLIVTPASLTVAEGSSKNFTVELTALPTGPVTVALSSDNGEVTVSPNSLNFSTSDWNTPQTVTVSAARDDDAEDTSATINLNPAGGGYDRLADGSVAVMVTDNDVTGAGLTVIPAVLTIPEGGTEHFTVALATVPKGPVTVPVSSDHGEVTVSPASLTFTPLDWNVERTVTVSAARDEDEEYDIATLGLNPSGGGYGGLADGAVLVTVTDGNVADAGLIMEPVTLTIAEGESGSFTLALAALPQGPVTVALASDNGDVTVSPNPLTFSTSDWNTRQTVTVSAARDDDAENDSATLTIDLSGGGYDDLADGALPVTVTDSNSTTPVAGLILAPISLTIPEGASENFTVALTAVPTGPVTVALASDNGDVTLDKTALTFTTSDWNTPQTVTVNAARDDDAEDDSATLTVDPSGGGYDDLADGALPVTVTEGDSTAPVAGLIVTPAHLTMPEGASENFTVALTAVPTGPVTVAMSSDHGEVTLDKAVLTFTPSDWNMAQAVTVSAARDDDATNESAMIGLDPSGGGYDNLADRALPVTITDGDVSGAGLTVTPASLTITEGASAPFTVALAAAPTGPVMVAVSSDHGDVAVSPANLIFTPSDWNMAQTVTVNAAQDDDATNESATLTVDPSGGGYGAVSSRTVAVLVEDAGALDAERSLAKPALVDVALDTLSGMSAALKGRFGGCETAVTLGGAKVGAGGSGAEGRTGERSLTPGEVLSASAFRWSAGCGGAQDQRWTVWGHGDFVRFSGGLTQGNYDGSLRTAWLGVDRYVEENLIAGAALSRGQGRTEFGRFSMADGTAELETSLTVGWPYLRIETRGGGALQLVLGIGSGTAVYRRAGEQTEKAELRALLASVSGETPLWRGGNASLQATGDLEAAQLTTSGSASGVLGGLRADGLRVRAGFEAEHNAFRLGGLSVAPHGAAAVAHDEGDGLAGTGLELSAGLRIATANPRFGVTAMARWLAMHSAEQRRTWGGGVEAVWKATPDGRGLSLSLTPTWGLQAEGTLQGPDVFTNGEETDGGTALTSRLGYGLTTPHGGLLTPFFELGLGEHENHRVSAGAEFEWQPDLAATLTGERHDAPDRPTDLSIGFDLHLRF